MPDKISGMLFAKTGVERLGKYLDLASLRHRLVSGNIANSATPGYKSRDIDFQKEFNKQMNSGNQLSGKLTQPGHIPLGRHTDRPPKLQQKKVIDGDLNSVDIDKEVTTMAQNEILFTIGAKLMKQKFDGLRKAITSR